MFCNNLFERHFADNIGKIKGNWTFPTATGTAYTQQLPRDYFRYFGIRIAYASK